VRQYHKGWVVSDLNDATLKYPGQWSLNNYLVSDMLHAPGVEPPYNLTAISQDNGW
jgi:hypothetical protein